MFQYKKIDGKIDGRFPKIDVKKNTVKALLTVNC